MTELIDGEKIYFKDCLRKFVDITKPTNCS